MTERRTHSMGKALLGPLAVLQSAREIRCDGRNPHSPRLLREHHGYHRDKSGAECLDDWRGTRSRPGAIPGAGGVSVLALPRPCRQHCGRRLMPGSHAENLRLNEYHSAEQVVQSRIPGARRSRGSSDTLRVSVLSPDAARY